MLHVAVAVAVFSVASPFDDLKAKAATVERLPSTVAALVGVCPDGLMPDELADCQKNLGSAAKGWAGKKVYINLGAVDPAFLALDGKGADTARLVWAPLIDLGNGLALTVGKPEKLSAAGNVVVARRPFEGSSDPELLDTDLQRAVKTGQVGVEIVGSFGKPWQLNGKNGPVRGVAFELAAVRFYHTRTGKLLVDVPAVK